MLRACWTKWRRANHERNHLRSLTRLFVTGTDTGVGKSFVTAALARALRHEGESVRALKPITSGVDAGPGEDALLLASAAGHLPPLAVTLRGAFSPHRAARLEGRQLELDEVAAWVESHAGPTTLVEGAGGWEVPCGPSWRIADLASRLGWPVLVVAPNQLGVINHSLLTVGAIRQRGLVPAGLVLSGGRDQAAEYNRDDLAELLPDVPVLSFPWTTGDGAEAAKAIWDTVRRGPAKNHPSSPPPS